MRAPATFAIVGAGQAGAWVARTLRTEGFDGRILLIGDERHWPYERPPLSKAVLAGAAEVGDSTLLTEGDAAALAIEAWLGETVTELDRHARRLTCADGRHLEFDRLFLTTGGVPRRPPWAGAVPAACLHVLRTADDARRLRAALGPGARLLVVGGGWIGLETAATARSLGCEVTLVELAPRLCQRSVPAPVSAYLRQLHEAQGVALRLGTACTGATAAGAGVALELATGERLVGDALVVGIGIAPDTRLAAACGLAVDDGILVDRQGRTSDAAIFAAGDATRRPSRFAAGTIRLESWQNAQNQAIVAARAALGRADVHDEVPWIWSDQFGHNLQIAGLPDRASRVAVRGDPAAGAATWLGLDADGRVVGAVALNAPRDLRVVRRTLDQGGSIDAARWPDLSVPAERLVGAAPALSAGGVRAG